ncbi:MAG: hypothetical protein LQ338_002479 [Usnochroma carphineum]|nr:MAG: hypothetical protein LQ338_002479 [Usnochroma carphineum]
MCLPTTVRRSANGRLIQERLLPPKLVPAERSSEKESDPPKDDGHTDPLAGPVLLSPSLSDKDNNSAKASVQPQATAPVKQHTVGQIRINTCTTLSLSEKPKPKPNQPTANSDEVSEKAEKQTEPARKKTRNAPLPPTHTTNPVQSLSESAPRSRERRVSFSDQLRGPGKSYTPPPSDEKSVRFAPSLVRGEGSGYNNLSPGKSEVFPFHYSSKGSSAQSSHGASKSSTGQPASTKDSQTVKMRAREPTATRDEQADVNIASDSDDSFAEVVMPAKPVKDRVSQRHNAALRHHGQPAETGASHRFSRSMQAPFRARQEGWQSEIGDHESFVDAVTIENTRRNSLTNRRLRINSAGSSALEASIRRGWPQPVFIFKGKTPPNVPSRKGPVFVLRGRSNSKSNVDASSKHVAATSTAKQPKWRYQPPSVVDDEVDDKIYWDPKRKMTTRDV